MPMNSNGSTLKDESFSDARSSLCARLGTGTSDSLFTDELMKALRSGQRDDSLTFTRLIQMTLNRLMQVRWIGNPPIFNGVQK